MNKCVTTEPSARHDTVIRNYSRNCIQLSSYYKKRYYNSTEELSCTFLTLNSVDYTQVLQASL